MPIYEYRCSNCGHELEVLQKLADPVMTSCPDCRTESLVKMISAAGFQLKGSGWYATDFRNGSKPSTKSEVKAESAGESKSESKSESKPESKSESKSDSSAPSTGCGGNCACH